MIPLEEGKKININRNRKIGTILIFLFVIILAISAVIGNYLFSPIILSDEQRITIPEGYSIIQTAQLLEEKKLTRSALAFRVLAQIDNIVIKAGTYAFNDAVSLAEIIERLRSADYGDVYTIVTLPEGITITEIADILSKNISGFDTLEFLELTNDKEGYLFPETYQFLPEVKTKTVVNTLLETFERKTLELKNQNLKRSWEDIVIMASLIEKEAGKDPEEQKIISGILWKRLDKGMLLQVDAPFVYLLGKGSSDLRISDLRTDNPYNTYTRKGLTPTPIGNPGIAALEAAVHPLSSAYYFYLHGSDGSIHYGITHNDHINNKNRYLR